MNVMPETIQQQIERERELSKAVAKERKAVSIAIPNKGTVVITFRNPKKTGMITLRSYRDRNGVWRRLVDENGEERVVRMSSTRILDLSNPLDRNEYECWLHHPVYYDTPNPYIRIIHREKEAKDKVRTALRLTEAIQLLNKAKDYELFVMCRMLGIQVDLRDDVDIWRAELIQRATANPDEVIDLYNRPDRKYYNTFYLAETLGIIVHTANGMYRYGEINMATSPDLAVQFLKNNDEIYNEIVKKIEEELKMPADIKEDDAEETDSKGEQKLKRPVRRRQTNKP